ncbi:MAG: MGMT family protein [Lactobacillaceae bacterium]|jgi:O-6-methylguanine DNA methyltransferase|nr:MGMT family protein [Lactobacillaceae bacterium]
MSEFVFYYKNQYGDYTFTYFYTQRGLVFTTFQDSFYSAFFKFFAKKNVIFQSKNDYAVTQKLTAYFQSGTNIKDVVIDWDFINPKPLLRQVMETLQSQTDMISYAELAQKINSPDAVRAVGTAVGKNPLEVIIPCHRVIKSNGHLGKYRDGAIIKEKLIELEKRII